jgi:hypothetical protein
LTGDKWLTAMLLYGGRLRLLEVLHLRVKDLDFDRGEGKGDIDRVTCTMGDNMPTQQPTRYDETTLHKFTMAVDVFGPIRPSPELNRQTQRALKDHSGGRDFFTDITLHDSRNAGGIRVEFTVNANSRAGAERAGAVYLSQLCDLLSVVTRSPVWFYMPDEDSRDERTRLHRRAVSVDRILTKSEWLRITGDLVFLRREHPRFLAAASWYRKGLIGKDNLDNFCCYWRVIEQLAYSYADKTEWTDDEKTRSAVKKYVQQLTIDLFDDDTAPDVLQDRQTVANIVKLRNDLSHGNVSITLEVIDAATAQLKSLEQAAFSVLERVRNLKLVCESPA